MDEERFETSDLFLANFLLAAGHRLKGRGWAEVPGPPEGDADGARDGH